AIGRDGAGAGAGRVGTGAVAAWARLSRASRTAVAAKPPKVAAAVRAMSVVARRMRVFLAARDIRAPRSHGGGDCRHQAERVCGQATKPVVKSPLTCAFHLFRTPPPGSRVPPLLG